MSRLHQIGALVSLALLVAGCSGSGASTPARDTARGFVLLAADALAQADHTCAAVALAKKDPTVAKTCADAYDSARPFLLSAEGLIDTYDGRGGPLLCTIGNAVAALANMATAITAAGGTVPPAVLDGLTMGKGLVCK